MNFTRTLNSRIHRLPLAASGLMLGVAGEGTLLSSYAMVKDIFGAIAFIILTLLLLKIVFDGKDVINGLRDASPAGSAFTFPMAIVILSVYVLPLQPVIAKCMFWTAILIHCVGILLFTKKFLIPFAIENIFPSTFVVYVGTVIISVVAPAFHKIVVGQIFLIFGFISYLILLPIILYRALTIESILKHPSNTILAAPASLCLVGYFHSFPSVNMIMVWLLTIMALIFIIYGIVCMPKMMTKSFNAACSAFTFPFVISANACITVNAFLSKRNFKVPIVNPMYIVYFVGLLAFCFVIYALMRYVFFLSIMDNEVLPGFFKNI